jgi:hypothetical protein
MTQTVSHSQALNRKWHSVPLLPNQSTVTASWSLLRAMHPGRQLQEVWMHAGPLALPCHFHILQHTR